MTAANKLAPHTHSKEEMEEMARKLEDVRDKLHQAQRRASGLPQARASP